MKLSQEQHAARFASAAIKEITEVAENVRRCLTQALGADGKPLWEGATPAIVRGGFTVEQQAELDQFAAVWADEKKEPSEAPEPTRFRKTYGGGEPVLPVGKKGGRKQHGK